ncbi:MAG: hypothetical protein HKP41_05910 [Desulfobacterales bacterium]|nr:hypothetical protein [Desulfobacterales bacterium]
MTEIQCHSCKWFEIFDDECGECRLHPPMIIEKLVGGNSWSNIFQATQHPIVSHHHWCGKFSPQEKSDLNNVE